MNWTVAEKEGFAVKDTMEKLDYLLQMKRPFKFFSDHKNLIQIFSPTNVSKPTAQKLQRWVLFIQRFRYEIEHIKGGETHLPDLLRRWGSNPCQVEEILNLVCRVTTLNIPTDARVRPLQNPEFMWPNIDEIKQVQKKWLVEHDSMRRTDVGVRITKSEKVIIPIEAEDLRCRLCIIAHAGGNSGHLGYQASAQKLTQIFHWKNCIDDMKKVCSVCLHQRVTSAGRYPRVP